MEKIKTCFIPSFSNLLSSSDLQGELNALFPHFIPGKGAEDQCGLDLDHEASGHSPYGQNFLVSTWHGVRQSTMH